jgi:hypothetical protein
MSDFIPALPGFYLVDVFETGAGQYEVSRVPIVGWVNTDGYAHPIPIGSLLGNRSSARPTGEIAPDTFVLAPDPDGRVYAPDRRPYPSLDHFRDARIKEQFGKEPVFEGGSLKGWA